MSPGLASDGFPSGKWLALLSITRSNYWKAQGFPQSLRLCVHLIATAKPSARQTACPPHEGPRINSSRSARLALARIGATRVPQSGGGIAGAHRRLDGAR